MTPPAGTLVKALPSAHAEEETTPEPLQGELQVIQVEGDKDFNLPPFTLYLIAGTPVDPNTIEQEQELPEPMGEEPGPESDFFFVQTEQFANPCHSPEDGRFCETPGHTHRTGEPRQGEARDNVKVYGSSPVKESVRAAIDAIDSVHSLPPVYRPVIFQETATEQPTGEYLLNQTGHAQIDVSSKGNHTALTFAHEFGHYIDHQFINRGEVMDTIKESFAYQQLQQKKGQEMGYADYLLNDKETFARAYAQYIATRSRHQFMLQHIERTHHEFGAKRDSQWDDADFAPIAGAFDEMFRSKGLLKEKEKVTASSLEEFHVCDEHDCKTHGNWAKGSKGSFLEKHSVRNFGFEDWPPERAKMVLDTVAALDAKYEISEKYAQPSVNATDDSSNIALAYGYLAGVDSAIPTHIDIDPKAKSQDWVNENVDDREGYIVDPKVLKSTIIHEFGHVLNFSMPDDLRAELEAPFKAIQDDFEALIGGDSTKGREYKNLIDTVSAYAGTDIHEGIAEAFLQHELGIKNKYSDHVAAVLAKWKKGRYEQ